MDVRIAIWKVKTLIQYQDKINEQPPYQRGDVWSDRKKALLIDSMLRGIDLPKIYLRRLGKGAFDYEVADGQQRLNAIYSFYASEFPLPDYEDKGLDLSKLAGHRVGGLIYEGLPDELKLKFEDYPVTIAIIEESSNHEIRTLFGRLQEGDPLVPAEKRNAIISSIGGHVDNFAINHKFFQRSRIAPQRFKRQDYLSNGLALIAYQNEEHLKAALLLKLYLDKTFKLTSDLLNQITTILDYMSEIDSISKVKIYKKYHFVDFFWFLYQSLLVKHKSIDIKGLAISFDLFEVERLKHYGNPRVLIQSGRNTKVDKDLYDYILAFKSAGAESDNIDIRHRVFNNMFSKFIKR